MAEDDLKKLGYDSLISIASEARCKLDDIETEILERIKTRSNKHTPSRVRAEKRTKQQVSK